MNIRESFDVRVCATLCGQPLSVGIALPDEVRCKPCKPSNGTFTIDIELDRSRQTVQRRLVSGLRENEWIIWITLDPRDHADRNS